MEAKVLIIGAGVIGLSIAKEISKITDGVYVIEKNLYFGQETSSRNSEVIHSGIYYQKNSLRKKLCIEGQNLLYSISEKYNIPFRKTGKLIVAKSENEDEYLNNLFKNGIENSCNISLLSKKQINSLEPNINARAAIFSPETGIIDSHKLMEYFYELAKENGADFALSCEVIAIKHNKDSFTVSVKEETGEIFKFKTQIVINSSGLDSDTVANLAGIDIEKSGYKLNYCAGRYFQVSQKKASLVNHLIYPVPEKNGSGLGIHAVLGLDGSLKLGPDAKYTERIKSYVIDDNLREFFLKASNKIFPFLTINDLSPAHAGIRPKLQTKGGDFRDFIIKSEDAHKMPNLINLIGIDSPGLTASPAIGKYVLDIVKNRLL